jgi:carboxyl-terminal processing protease
MKISTSDNGSHRLAWGATAAIMVLLSTLSLSVPRAFAQTNEQKTADAKRYLQTFDNIWKYVLQNYVEEPDPKKLYEGAMKGLLDSLGDPHTVFLDETMMSDMNDLTSGSFGGVGLYISKQAKDPKKAEDEPRYIEIVSPIEDTPGWNAGIMPGDLIIKIDGEPTAPLTVDEAKMRIRGTPGSAVTLSIRRGGQSDFDVSVKRANIVTPVVKKALIPGGTAGGPPGLVGYIRIIEFTAQAKDKVAEAIAEFKRAGYTALILDVRNDPGGLLSAAVEVANLFIDKGLIVSTKGRNPQEDAVYNAKPGLAMAKDVPIVVLLNKGSASASEILAGALKDQKRAYLVGENSYGKGSVQQIYPIDATGFKMTTARYFTPSDENIDKTGIPPDLAAKDPDLSKAEIEILDKLVASGKIADFAKSRPEATVADRNALAASLMSEFPLPERVLRLLIHDALQRTKIAPAYDLEFDVALKAALELLGKPGFDGLVAGSKSVRELVETKKAAAAGTVAGGTTPLQVPEVKAPKAP